MGSMRVPLAYVRFVSDKSRLATKLGEFIDGKNSAKPYLEGAYKVAMTHQGGNVYKALSYSEYKDYDKLLMDENTKPLPFYSGNASIRVNGLEVAHSRDKHENSKKTGKVLFQVKEKYLENGIKIGDEFYKIVSAEAILSSSEYSVSITFDKELPAGTTLNAHLRIDYEAKDENGTYKVKGAGVESLVEYDSIQASPDRIETTLSAYVIKQHQNELGFSLVATALSILQGKYFLEQQRRLYEDAITIARHKTDEKFSIDLSRGAIGNIASAINTTGDLMGEIFKTLDYAQDSISKATGGATTSFSLLVSDKVKHLLNTLPADKYKRTGNPARYNEMVRIGTLNNNIDVYYLASEHGLLTETDDSAEIAMLGYSSEPTKNLFVGTIVQPLLLTQISIDSRELTVSLDTIAVADVNPNDYYAQQVCKIDLLNLPVLSVKS